jgi:serine/threonine protein kinase
MSASFRERYEFRECVGTDYLGEVWLALGPDHVGPVRIRVVTQPVLCEPDIRDSVLEEVRRVFRVQDPGLLHGVECGVDDSSGQLVVVTEWADGSTLGKRLRREGRISESEALRMADEIARALGEVWHAEQVCHALLTPDSIHLWPEGRLSVLDLGVTGVRALLRAGRVADAFRLLRSQPFYTSPELARGDPSADSRADMYSLGAILYHALTGRVPFGDRPSVEALDKHLLGFLEDPADIQPGLRPATVALMEMLMARKADRRWSDWSEVRAAIAAAAAGEWKLPTLAPGDSVLRRGERRAPGLAESLKRPSKRSRRGLRPLRPNGGNAQKAPATRAAPPNPSFFPSRTRDTSGLRIFALALVIAALAVYGLRDHFRPFAQSPAPSQPQPRRLPSQPFLPISEEPVNWDEIFAQATQRTSTASSRPRNDEIRPIVEEPAQSALGSSEDAPPPDPLLRHPSFQRAAKLFNESLKLFQQFRDAQNVSLLDQVEAMNEEAARLFEQLKTVFPEDPRPARYMEQCFRMVYYARQSKLASGAITGGGGSRSPSSAPRSPFRPPLPAPPSSVAPP